MIELALPVVGLLGIAAFGVLLTAAFLLTVADAFRTGMGHGLACVLFNPYCLVFLAAFSEHRLRWWLLLALLSLPLALLVSFAIGFVLFAEASPVLPFVYAVL